MANIFLISDTHFNHANCLNFKRYDGTPLRPGFTDVNHMDETLIVNWNSVVKPNDKIYHLGDIAMCNSTKFDAVMSRLNGQKILVKGNHDEAKIGSYIKWFKDIRGSCQLDRCILTHIPIHEESLSRWELNVHGHLHANSVMKDGKKDPRYFCVSVEQINYTPIAFEEIRRLYK